MTTDLFGDPIPTNTVLGIIKGYLVYNRQHGPISFNSYRAIHKIEKVPKHVGALVRAACLSAGFEVAGDECAKVRASHGRRCLKWRAPR